MKIDIEYVEKLAKVLADNSLSEISLEDGEQAITVRKDMIVSAAAPVAVPQNTAVQSVQSTSEPAPKGKPITSPMVGTFYKSPSPDSDPFVTEGSDVKQGDLGSKKEARNRACSV